MKALFKGINTNMRWMFLIVLSFFMLYCGTGSKGIMELSGEYIEAWKQFYPSQAFASGDKGSAFRFEHFDKNNIEEWVMLNKNTLGKINELGKNLSHDDRIDVRMLKRQVRHEIEKWDVDMSHINSPVLYSEIISGALTYVLGRRSLTPEEQHEAIRNRLFGIREICDSGIRMLKNGRPSSTKRCVQVLKSSTDFYEQNLPVIAEKWVEGDRMESFKKDCMDTAARIRSLKTHIETEIFPNMTMSDTLGKEDYARKLRIFTDVDLTPDELETIALEEINEVRQLMADISTAHWKEAYPDLPVPYDFKVILDKALEDMEADGVDNREDFLLLFVDLVNRAETFVRKENIATLPEKQAVVVDISPDHFPWAAVGGTYTVGPFDPDANTILYLPSIPDSAPEDVKEGFYRSFNNYFNTMIITHEIFPGHHLQFKIAARNPRLVRSLFSDGLYVEGWATLCEVVTLDAGWNGFNKLDRLAHLRKRLENATRAYTSVQVHFKGWNKDKVSEFAVNKGLLAPQFAINLWNRVIDSPLQLPAYFLGFKKFSALLAAEKERLGGNFRTLEFSDKVLNAGAVPIDELPNILENNKD